MPPTSPLAPERFPAVPALAGVRIATAACGVRYRGRDDVFLMEFVPGTAVAGVLTRSSTASAPVLWCRRALAGGSLRALVVNAGNANAFTGKEGEASVARTVEASARLAGCQESEIMVASTGVIGEILPDRRITDALSGLTASLRPDAWEAAARAMMTTDTFAKGATRATRIGGVPVTINGIAKGSGMIQPDMATMLAFVATDAALPSAILDRLLRRAADRSFHAITVDGDTSTSDTLLLAATGRAGNAPVRGPEDPVLRSFRFALQDLLVDLAQQVVRDGEGASKFVTIRVSGARSARAARRVGLAIGNSPLVKTAIAGSDPNWGRIVMAVGKSGEAIAIEALSIAIGDSPIVEQGQIRPDYDEAPVAEHMRGQDIVIDVHLGVGSGKATVWTCDLTHGYVDINADYRS